MKCGGGGENGVERVEVKRRKNGSEVEGKK